MWCCVCLFVASWGWRGGGKSPLLVRLRRQRPHDGQKATETKVQCRTLEQTLDLCDPRPQRHLSCVKRFSVYLSGMLSLLATALKAAWFKIELVKWSSCFGSVDSRHCLSNHRSVMLFKMIVVSPPRCWQCYASTRCIATLCSRINLFSTHWLYFCVCCLF